MAGRALVLFCLVIPAWALDPNIVQLDLVFPRNNTVYKPVYPFPIVFALHNLEALWDYDFLFTWSLVALEPQESLVANHLGRVRDDGHPLPPNPHLLIESTRKIINRTATTFSLRYSLAIYGNCTADHSNTDPRDVNEAIHGFIRFSTNDTADLPDIAAAPCSEVLLTVGVEGNSTLPDTRMPCPILAEPAPAGESCALRIDSAIEDRVASEMLAAAACPPDSKSWPDVTLVDKCPSRADRNEVVGVTMVLFAAGCLGFIVLLSSY